MVVLYFVNWAELDLPSLDSPSLHGSGLELAEREYVHKNSKEEVKHGHCSWMVILFRCGKTQM